jgi:hypothetical protein
MPEKIPAELTFADAVAAANKITSESPTCRLRWRGGVLQQKWRVVEFEGWREVAERFEWRDIPTDET